MPCAKPMLLVEDDTVDAMAIKRALHDAGVADAVVHMPLAQEAIEYLRSSENKPSLILLDLTMPDTDGLEFLEVIKADPTLKDIPVVALTSSDEPQHILSSFDLGIAGYMVKPSHYENLVNILRIIRSYWSLSKLPMPLT